MYFPFTVDPYAGKRKITEEARIQESVKTSLLADLKAAGWTKQPNRPVKESRKEGKKDKKKDGKGGDAKVSRLCPDFNTASGCSVTGESCPKGQHRCSRRSGDFVCLRSGHGKQACDHPKLQ